MQVYVTVQKPDDVNSEVQLDTATALYEEYAIIFPFDIHQSDSNSMLTKMLNQAIELPQV